MEAVGPVELREVRLVLERRLTEVAVRPHEERYGGVFVASTDDVRGLAFDVVFVPGLAEKLFPQKVIEDPILPDRARTGTALPTNRDRAAARAPRAATRGGGRSAARRPLVSAPRRRAVSPAHAVVLRARGAPRRRGRAARLRRARRAARTCMAPSRVGWPAPAQPGRRHRRRRARPLAPRCGPARGPKANGSGYGALPPLGQRPPRARAPLPRAALAARKWTDADGLVAPTREAHGPPRARTSWRRARYSPTGLQNYAACPYRFVLQAIHRLSPREEPAPLEELDPLQRGSLVHEVLVRAPQGPPRRRVCCPSPRRTSSGARARSTACSTRSSRATRTISRPPSSASGRTASRASARTCASGCGARPSTRRGRRRSSSSPSASARKRGATPGAVDADVLARLRDPAARFDRSRREERGRRAPRDRLQDGEGPREAGHGHRRRRDPAARPVRAALEKLRPGGARRRRAPLLLHLGRRVHGRSTCRSTPRRAKRPRRLVAETVQGAIAKGVLARRRPDKKACEYCDYQRVCGPYEEQRTARKRLEELAPLDSSAEAAVRALADQAARDRIRRDLDTTLVVEAAAGTGKTTELVQRIMALLCTGKATLARIVAVTFTEKAAGEMKLRLRTEIERARDDAAATWSGRAWTRARRARGGAHRDDPRVLRRPAAAEPRRSARRPALRGRRRRPTDAALRRGVRALVPAGPRRSPGGRAARSPPASARLGAHRGRATSLREAGLALVQQRDFEAPWRRDPFARDPAIDQVMAALDELSQFAPRASNPRGDDGQEPREIERFVSEVKRREAVRGRDYDGLEEELRTLGRQKFWGVEGVGEVVRRPPAAQRRDGAAATRRESASMPCSSAPTPTSRPACTRTFGRSSPRTTRARRVHGKLDFLDLLLVARNLVRDHEARAARAPGPLHAPPRRRVPGHRPAAGRDPAPARGRRPDRDLVHARRGPCRASSSSSATRSSRSTASAAPT